MAVQQNPRLTDGWWIVKLIDWGRGLTLLTDGWWFPECLPLDIIELNLKVCMNPYVGVSIMDQIDVSLGIIQNISQLQLQICKEKEDSISINREEEVAVGIATEVDVSLEG